MFNSYIRFRKTCVMISIVLPAKTTSCGRPTWQSAKKTFLSALHIAFIQATIGNAMKDEQNCVHK